MRKPKTTAQSIVEYAVLLTVIALAVAAMRLYVMRSAQAQMKLIQDQINNPQDADD